MSIVDTIDKPVKCSSGLGRILLVPTLFVLLIIFSKFGLAPLHSQWHTVIIVVSIYLIFVPFVFHNAFYVTCKAKKRLKKLQDEIDTYLHAHQWKSDGVSKSIGSVEPLFENFEQRLRNDHFAGVAAGVFPTLGILGTFISIAISMPDFSVETSQALEQEISKLLGGVGTAFYASIFGIFLSLWWIFFEKSGLSHFDAMLLKIHKDTEAKIWTVDELKLIELKQQQQIYLESKNLVDGLGLSKHNIQDELKGIYDSYAQLHRDVNRLSQDIHIHVDSNIKQLTLSANTMMSQQLLQKEMQSQIESLSLKLTRQSDEQAELHRRFERIIAVQEKVSLSSQSIAEMNASVLGKFENFNIEQTTQKLLDFAQALQDAQESQKENYNQQMREGFELIDKEVSYIVQRLSEVALEISKSGIHISNTLKNRS